VRITERIHLVGSGSAGFDLTDELDCHVYLIDGADSWALVDAGAGRGSELIVEQIRATGVSTTRSGHLLLTHGHADHAGGTLAMQRAFPQLLAVAGEPADRWIATADTVGLSLDRATAAGVYPTDYRFPPGATVSAVADGDVVELGDAYIVALETPGHCDGHVCYLLEEPGRRTLFSGDCLFTNGRVSLQHLHDLRIDAYAGSIARLADIEIDTLLPGHHAISLTGAGRHVRSAAAAFDSGLLPPSIA